MALTVASRAALSAMKRARGSTQDEADIESLSLIDRQAPERRRRALSV